MDATTSPDLLIPNTSNFINPAYSTPSQRAQLYAYAQAMMNPQPVKNGWQGLGEMARALMGGMAGHQADVQEQASRAYDAQLAAAAAGRAYSPGPGGAAPMPTQSGAPSASASTPSPQASTSGSGYDYAMPTNGANTAGLNPVFADRAQDLQQDAQDAGIGSTLVSGYRPPEQQAHLYANYIARKEGKPLPYPNEGNGGLAAPPGGSYHNYGNAADIVTDNRAQQPELTALASEPWRGIYPGANFGDADHYQIAGPINSGSPMAYAAGAANNAPAAAAINTAAPPAGVNPAAKAMGAALIGGGGPAPVRVAQNGSGMPISGATIGQFLADPNIDPSVKHQVMETIAPRPMTDALGNTSISYQNQPPGAPIFQGGVRGPDIEGVMQVGTGTPNAPRSVVVPPGIAGAPAASAPANAPIAGQPQSGVPNIRGPGSVVGDITAQRAAQEAANAQTVKTAGIYTDEFQKAREDEIASQQASYPLHQLQAVLATHQPLPSGKGAEDLMSAQSVANMISTYLGHPIASDDSTLTGMELLRKYGGQVSQAIASRLGVHSNMGMESAQETSPGVNLSNAANEHLVDNLVRLNDLALRYNQNKQSYYSSHNKSLDGFNDYWRQSISGANAIPLSKFGRAVKLRDGSPGIYVPSTDPSGFSLFPANAPEFQPSVMTPGQK